MAKPLPSGPGDDPFTHAHNVEVERAVLGVVLDGRVADAWWTVREHCAGAAAFWHQPHRLLALVVDHMANAGRRIDAVSVGEAARQIRWRDAIDALKRLDEGAAAPLSEDVQAVYDDSLLNALGGVNAVTDLAGIYAPASGLVENAKILAACHRQRRLIADLFESLRRAKEPGGRRNAPTIVEETINRLSQTVCSGQGSDSVSKAAERVLTAHDEASVSGDQITCSWGIEALDKACRLVEGTLIVLAARPGCGKTSMMLQAATATRAKLGPERVALVTLEMSAEEVTGIIIGREIGAGRSEIERGWLSTEKRARFIAAKEAWRANDVPIKETGGNTIGEICGWARALKRRSGGRLKLLAIDYLQIIPGKGPRQTDAEHLSEITRSLKLLARDERLVVLLLCQMNREILKEKRRPSAKDLRGSGSIEQDADAIVFLHGDPDDKPPIMPISAIVAKNRRGEETTHGLEFLRAYHQTFRSVVTNTEGGGHGNTRMYDQPRDDEDHFKEKP